MSGDAGASTSTVGARWQGRWLRFGIGVGMVAGFFWFLTTRPLPPGPAGEIIDRNLRENVEATALFYADLERMPAIEARLEGLRARD